jgi:hypothetical protein
MSDKLPPDHDVSAHKDKMGMVMHKFKRGQLHSGTGKKGRRGPVVKSRAQAIAIGISESKHVEQLMAMGYSEEAARTVASFIESQKLGDYASEGPLSDVDSTPGKQKGSSGRKKEPDQGSVATFPTVPHSETVEANTGSTACPPKKTEAEKQAEQAQRGTTPTQPQGADAGQGAQEPAERVQDVQSAAEKEAKRQQREECKKLQGN